MNRLALLIATLVLAIQWPLWLGHGGWVRVWDLQHQLAARQAINAGLRARNQALVAEIASLRQGSEAIEERARGELHMMRAEETFFQFRPAPPASGSATGPDEAPLAWSGQPLELGRK
jgi:cell division protein FtsB